LSAPAGKKGNEQEAAAGADPAAPSGPYETLQEIGYRSEFVEFNGKPAQSVKTASREKGRIGYVAWAQDVGS
jgi:hypothetical protein